MAIGIIGSGGDGAGMNECLYMLCKNLKNEKIVLFNRGFQGIIENDVANFTLKDLKKERAKGGIIIKSSRSADFMTEKGFKKCIKNLLDNKVDALIVMGGNGSLTGTRELVKAGVNCIFIPTTIDNDIKESDYSIGFSTAVANAVDFIEKVNTSMMAFNRTCIYEVMGRHCPDIANSVSTMVGACYCYTKDSSKEDCLKVVKKELKTNSAPIVILQENVINIDELKSYLQDNLKKYDIKSAVVGYVQRGGYATKKELEMADKFAFETVKTIKNNETNKLIKYDVVKNNFYAINIDE